MFRHTTEQHHNTITGGYRVAGFSFGGFERQYRRRERKRIEEKHKEVTWTEQLIIGLSLGMTEQEFWNSTPFELYIRQLAQEEKIKRESIVNMHLLNNFLGAFGGSSVTYDDIFGYLQIKDLKLKQITDFRLENGKIDHEKWREYLKNTAIPEMEKHGLRR